MKLGDMQDRGRNRSPLRTTAELAAELGMTSRRLSALIRAHPDAPQPELKRHGRAQQTWHDPIKVKAWLKKYLRGTADSEGGEV